MPRLFLAPLSNLGWLSSLSGPAPGPGVAAPAAPPPFPFAGAPPFAFLDECGINSQIAARRLRVLQRLGALLRRHIDADVARRRQHREQIRSLVRLRSDAFAACARLRSPSTVALPKSAAVLLAQLHASTTAMSSSDCSLAEQQQLTLANRARSAVAAAAADVHALELDLQRLAAAARASLGTLGRLSVAPDPAAGPAMRPRGGSGRDWATMPLPTLYRAVRVSEGALGCRISECLSHLRLASDILRVFAPLPAQTPPATNMPAASLPARLTTASSARPAPHLADSSSVMRPRRASDPFPEFESPEESLVRERKEPARTLRTEGLVRGRGRSSQSAAREILGEEHVSRDLSGRLEQDDTVRSEIQIPADIDRKAPSMMHAARHGDGLRHLHPAGALFPPSASVAAQRGKSQHRGQTSFDAEPDGVLVPFPPFPRQLPAAASRSETCMAGPSAKRRIETCGPKLPKRRAGDGRGVPGVGARLPAKAPPAFRA